MSLHPRRRAALAALPVSLLLAVTLLSTGCASTTYDETLATSATTAPATTTTVPTGSAAELLPRLRDEAASLSGVMIDEGDADAVAARIVALWEAAGQEVGRTRPDLVVSFDDNVALVLKAVRYLRAADADKASKNFDALVDAFLGS
ncbi:MAG: hypothetical protein NTZ21_07630 [Actinobacteria bacterium]|nr:hypothetical protein [Actinomycetota bacterium]